MRATYPTMCGTVVQGHTKNPAKKPGKCKLRASNGLPSIKNVHTNAGSIFSCSENTVTSIDHVSRDTCESCCHDASEVIFGIYFEY
jgi:hypothetical protein